MEENPNIVCDHCGGTDFYKEAGYFFCSGCQIQSQEVQEYAFDDFALDTQKSKAKKIQSDKTDKTENKITSWECYNYVLLGLTQELINLGADKKLKNVVKILWLKYLEKLEVFKRGSDELPKLQGINSAMDGEIIYGKLAKKKRKRKSSSSETDTNKTLDSSSMKHERARRKRALVKAEYEDFSQKSQAGTSSLHNETLVSLQSGSDKSSKNVIPITYHYYARRELNRIKNSRYHWRKHKIDFEHNLKCHKMRYKDFSPQYQESPYKLSINKLYAILYLALLIVQDKIQLSDMLRFVKEGHLSYNCYSHFFPEDFFDKTLNFRNFTKARLFSNFKLREYTSDMAKFLHVDYYVRCPDLLDLCERYCKELNLPQSIFHCCKKIMSEACINMSFRKRTRSIVPNYEGRVLSIILFVIKLLFGLDGVTEFHLGNYAKILNKSDAVEPKMFDITEWLKFIEYRKIVMTNQHFVTSFCQDKSLENVSLALCVLGKKEYPTEIKIQKDKDDCKQVLTKLKNELDVPETIDVPVTLTPFLDYTKLLPKTKFLKILQKSFTNNRLDHILRPYKFLEIANKGREPEMVHGGGNEDWVLEKIVDVQALKKRRVKERQKLITVKLSLDSKVKTHQAPEEVQFDSTKFREDFQLVYENKFRKNLRRIEGKKLTSVADLDLEKIRQDVLKFPESYPQHYNPHERFWIRPRMDILRGDLKNCRKFLKQFAYSFRVVFDECLRISQQSESELYTEYQFTELYLVYRVNFGKKDRNREIQDKKIATFLDNYSHTW